MRVDTPILKVVTIFMKMGLAVCTLIATTFAGVSQQPRLRMKNRLSHLFIIIVKCNVLVTQNTVGESAIDYSFK